ncbi:hypothetical protein ES703_99459 [subsurface metagenome]
MLRYFWVEVFLMSEESLREIIGIAKKSKWNQIKKFITFIIKNTLKKDAGYSLTALDVSLNGKKELKYDQIIRSKEEIKEIDKIKDFNYISLYQATPSANNHIYISQNNGTIIVLAKYLGPCLNNHQVFDFSVNLDAINEPFFTIGNGKKFNCSEILKIINKRTEPVSVQQKEVPKKKLKEVKDAKIENIEAFVFEKLTNKNAIWNVSETKAFQKWKTKIKNKYRIETGKITHYKGKPTNKFTLHLKSLLKNIDVKKKKPKKIIDKKPLSSKKDQGEFSEQYVFETVTGKNAIWNGSETKDFQKWKVKTKNKYRKETGKISHYKGKPTKKFTLYLKSLLKNIDVKKKKPKKTNDKKSLSSEKDQREFSEQYVFETVTGKNTLWNGSETQNFLKWKHRIHQKYKKDTGKNPYYKQNLTKNYWDYLKNIQNFPT